MKAGVVKATTAELEESNTRSKMNCELQSCIFIAIGPTYHRYAANGSNRLRNMVYEL